MAIETEHDYTCALSRIDQLFYVTEGLELEELRRLVNAVEVYEEEKFKKFN